MLSLSPGFLYKGQKSALGAPLLLPNGGGRGGGV